MKSIITRLILAGLMTLPAACATYSGQYYDPGYGYYPSQYGSSYGYGVVERNYYDTYSYPVPVYRNEVHHHHHDGRNYRYPDRRYQDGRRYSNSPAPVNRKPGSRDHGANGHYNWNAPAAKPYDNRKREGNSQWRDNRNEGRQRRPDDPNEQGQRRRQQNWDRQEAKRQNSGSGKPSFDRAGARGQFNALQTRQNQQKGPQSPKGRRQRKEAETQSGG
jgi:hypothetical protein